MKYLFVGLPGTRRWYLENWILAVFLLAALFSIAMLVWNGTFWLLEVSHG